MTFLAIKYLLSRRRQTVLMLLGIFFGTAAFVSISGFMLGFREFLINQLVNNNPHIQIRAREDFLTDHSLDHSFYGVNYNHIFWNPPPSGRKDSSIVENPQSWYERLKSDPRVVAYSPQLTVAGLFTLGKTTATGSIIGCDPQGQVQVTTIGDYVVDGKFSDLSVGGNRLIIGSELQRKLGVSMYQTVFVSVAASTPQPFKIVGIIKTGSRQTDNGAYGAIGDIQKLNGTLNQVNNIAVRIHDHTQAYSLAKIWSDLASEKVESWDELNANVFEVFKVQDAIRFLSIGSIMVVAGFGIYNVLNMTVMQKRRDIAILRSMGFSTYEIITLFFSQGLILGLSGAILGLVFGYVLGYYIESIEFAGGPLGRGVGHLLVSRNPDIYIQAGFLALASSLIASILPAYSAGKLTPIEIIREGAE